MPPKNMFGKHKDFARLVKIATTAGWKVDKRKAGHVCFETPDGRKVFTSSTPSDKRAFLNLRSELRRHGLTVD